jgi:hypothetical protein
MFLKKTSKGNHHHGAGDDELNGDWKGGGSGTTGANAVAP